MNARTYTSLAHLFYKEISILKLYDKEVIGVTVGFKGKLFKIIKFRTMRVHHTNGASLLTLGESDKRITSIGSILRKYKLDELPQLINVLLGQMSFVGPRPEVPKYVQLYNSKQRRILNFRPGITDLASLHFIDEDKLLGQQQDPEKFYCDVILPKKIALNICHIENSSNFKDFQIILKTLSKILFSKRS